MSYYQKIRVHFAGRQPYLFSRVISIIIGLSMILVILTALMLIFESRRTYHIKMATGPAGTEYHTFGMALKQVIEAQQSKFRIELVTELGGSHDSISRLQSKQVDLALAQNDTPAEESVRSLVLLFPEVIHLYARPECSENINQLRERKIATLPQNSGTFSFLKTLYKHYGFSDTEMRFITNLIPSQAHETYRENAVDAVFHIIALGPTAKDYIGPALEQGATLMAIEQVGALKGIHPFLQPCVIPKGFYGGYPPRPDEDVASASVHAVLLARSDLKKWMVYEIIRILFEHRNELIQLNPLAASIKAPDDPEEILFPLHPGARAYFQREKPGFLVRYAETCALILSIVVLAGSGCWHLHIRFQQRLKNQADMYNLEILDLIEQVNRVDTIQEIQDIRIKLFDIFRRVIHDLDNDKISPENFQLFTFPWEMAIETIRYREKVLIGTTASTNPNRVMT